MRGDPVVAEAAILRGLRQAVAARVLTLPRFEGADGVVEREPVDPVRSQRLASLAAAFHSVSAPVVWVWHRPATGGPVELLTAGASVAPPGATMVPVESGGLWKRLSGMASWSPLHVRTDALVDDDTRTPRDPVRGLATSIETTLLGVWHRPFALAVLAEPVVATEAAQLIASTAANARQAGQRRESSADHAIAYERYLARHRELYEGESLGLWRVRLLAGGSDESGACAVAGLVAASVDLNGLPYTLVPTGQAGSFVQATERAQAEVAGSRLVAALTRPPSVEIPGLRLVAPPQFDVTPEGMPAPTDRPELQRVGLGAVLDRQSRPAGQFTASLSSLNRHTFVCGATGAGKSQTIRHLLEQLTETGIPWLVVEPAKAEYRRMASRLDGRPGDEVVVVRPGNPHTVPAGIDPLRPADGFPLQTHLDLVRALFLAAFDAQEPFPQVIAAALTRAYEEQGWDVALGEPALPGTSPRYPTLTDLESCAQRVVREIGYGREVADNVRGFIRVRLRSLRLGTTGRFLEGGHPLDIGKLLQRNVVLELEDVGDDRDKAFLMGTVLIALTEHLRVAQRKSMQGTRDLMAAELRHITVVEEAHRLLRRTEGRAGAEAHAVEMFAALLAEVRAYGEGIVIAEQIPAKLVPDVIKNTAVKIVHRLPAQDDRDTVGATMNLSQAQSAYVVTLPPGTAAVFTDGMDNPVLVRMPDGTTKEALERGRRTGPEELTRTVSGRCAADYRLNALPSTVTLRGSRVLETEPLIRIWVELELIAHLQGKRGLGLSEPVYAAVDSVPAHIRQAALTHAVDEAVATRTSVLHRWMDPAALAAHLAEGLQLVCIGGPVCDVDETKWVAAPFRWSLVLSHLEHADPDAKRHEHSDEWALRYGRPIEGTTIGEQLASVRQQRGARDVLTEQAVLFGDVVPSLIERFVTRGRRDPAFPASVRQALEPVCGSEIWPSWYLSGYSPLDAG